MTPREQKAYNDALKETQSLNRTIASQMDNLIGKSDKRNKLLSNELNIAKDIVNNIESQEDVENAINKLTAQRSKINNTNLGVNNKLKNTTDAILTSNIQILKNYLNQKKMLEQVSSVAEEVGYGIKQSLDNIRTNIENIPIIGDALSKGIEPFRNKIDNVIDKSVGKFIGGFSDASRTAGGGLKNSFQAGMKGGITELKNFSKVANRYLGGVSLAAIGIGLALVGVFSLALKSFNELDEANESFRKETGLLISQTGQLTKNIRQSGIDTVKLGASMEDVSSAASAFVGEFDGIVQPSEQVLTSMITLNKNFGIGVEEGAKLNKVFQDIGNLTAEQAQHLIGITAEMAKQAGVAPSQVVKDIAENSEAAYKFFGGSVQELSKAAVRAAKLGTSIGQAADVASNLLDFEQSITKEFEASAILGQNLNLNEARRLAASGNILEAQQATVEAAMALGDISKLNVYEQEALAEATGMAIPDLVRQQRIKERFGKLDEDQLAAAMALSDAGKDITKISKEDLDNQTKQLAKQQEIQSQVNQIKNEFKAISQELGLVLAPAIGGIVTVVGFLVKGLSMALGVFGSIGEKIGSLASEAGRFGKILAGAFIVAAAMASYFALSVIPIVGPALGAAAAAAVLGFGFNALTKVGDLGIDPNGGPIVASPREGGIFQGSRNDGLSMGPSFGANGGGNMDVVVNELRELKRAFLSNKDVYMDSVKVTNEVTRVSEKSSDNIFGLGAA